MEDINTKDKTVRPSYLSLGMLESGKSLKSYKSSSSCSSCSSDELNDFKKDVKRRSS